MWVYAIECETENYWYVGQTNDPHRRVAEHRGYGEYKGSPFVQKHGFKRLAHLEESSSREMSLVRERALALEMIEAGMIVKTNTTNVTNDGRVIILPSKRDPSKTSGAEK